MNLSLSLSVSVYRPADERMEGHVNARLRDNGTQRE